MSGSNTVNQPSVYYPSLFSVPGARQRSVSWTDSTGNLWLFGGFKPGGLLGYDYFNDLWRFDGTYWIWMSGSNTVSQPGYYGTMGSPSSINVPGARDGSVSWTDSVGNMWLFGGQGYDVAGSYGLLNDLWRFDGTYWTWMSGNNTIYSPAVYGTLGSPASTNVPGARYGSVSWTDSADNLWLFGGHGYIGPGNFGYLNDLWKFDGTYWTWMSGSNTFNSSGVYGTMGSPAATNVPGARRGSVSWTDSADNLWLFGGYVSGGYLNDLWKYDGTDWTWMSGNNTTNQPGYYGTQGSPGARDVPGARWGSVSWTDSTGSLWLFGGYVSGGYLNDLWRFDGTYWTWISGSSTINSPGVYGTLGSPASTNVPGARYNSVSWTDNLGNLWLFGGDGIAGASDHLNDLWRYSP